MYQKSIIYSLNYTLSVISFFYNSGLERIQASIPTIQEAVEILGQFQEAWGFKLEDSYRIVLSRYGTGGSYNGEAKEIIMRTTKEGLFVKGNPAAIPILEITHLCVEHLVQRYHLSFAEKERLVKGIDSTLFPEIFDIDNSISDSERQSRLAMLKTLPAIIAKRNETTAQEVA